MTTNHNDSSMNEKDSAKIFPNISTKKSQFLRDFVSNNAQCLSSSPEFDSIPLYFQLSPSLCVNTANIAVLPAHILSGTRKPVKTVLSGPRKHSERFGCNSHIGQLNATTSALSLPFAYSIHMLMMSLVFFSPSCMCVCAYVFMCAICFSLCVYFFSVLPPLLPVSLYHQTKKMQKIWIHTSL